jgi:zinc/manganese transport system substrate-binding protein
MSELDSANAAAYQAGFRGFAERWKAAITRWEGAAASLRGKAVVTQHKSYVYLFDWLGLKELATLEPKPGVEPSVAYLGELVAKLSDQKPRAVIRSAYNSPRPAEWYAAQAHVPLVVLPFTVGGDDRAQDLFGLFDDTVARLTSAIK